MEHFALQNFFML